MSTSRSATSISWWKRISIYYYYHRIDAIFVCRWKNIKTNIESQHHIHTCCRCTACAIIAGPCNVAGLSWTTKCPKVYVSSMVSTTGPGKRSNSGPARRIMTSTACVRSGPWWLRGAVEGGGGRRTTENRLPLANNCCLFIGFVNKLSVELYYVNTSYTNKTYKIKLHKSIIILHLKTLHIRIVITNKYVIT